MNQLALALSRSGSLTTCELIRDGGTTLLASDVSGDFAGSDPHHLNGKREETLAQLPATAENISPKSGTADSSWSRRSEKNPFALDATQFLPEHHKKDLIVLHFTAGRSCESAFKTWQADPRRIATAFGVDPDGTVARFFPPEAWAYHLGIKGTNRHDQRSIGIEIANVGPLRPDPANPRRLNWWPSNWRTQFCQLEETDCYVESEYRGMRYFAAMPTAQLEATGLLVRSLCRQFGIPQVASEAAHAGQYDPVIFSSYQGVASHSNFRQDKWDVGPAFRWEYLGF